MEKLTREQFKSKYGFDPIEEKSKFSQAPKQGAVSGSTVKPVTFTTEQMQRLSGKSTKPVTFTAEQKAYIDSIGGPAAFGGSQAGSKVGSTADKQLPTESQTESGFKPNKITQAMEDYRPDYSGGFFSDISEGMADVGVGVVKGIARTVPEIVQTLTPDAMWGDNSIFNSESERANAFRSATTGKTGLQKLGATGVDLASMFVPVGAAGKAVSLSNRGAQGASRLAKMVTGGMDLATEAPSLLQRGGKLLNTVAPSVGDSVVSGAIAGRGESPVTDIALGTLSPVAGKALGVMSEAFGSQQAKSALAGVKDYFVGGNKYKNQIFDSAMKEINDKGIDVLKEKIPQVAENRVIIRELLKTQLGKMFGKGSKGIDKLNEASDIFTLGYFDKLEMVDGIADYTKVQDALTADKDIVGGIIGKASNIIKGSSIPTQSALKSLSGKMASTGINKFDDGYKEAKRLVSDFIIENTNGGKKELTIEMLGGLRSSLTKKMQKLQPTEAEMKKLYAEIYSWTNDMIYNVAKKSGNKDVAGLIKEANSAYSKLKNVDDVVNAMSKTRTNPFGLTQGQKIALSYGAGAAGGMAGGPLGVPAAMIVANPISKIVGSLLTNRAISKVKSNVYKKASSAQRTKQQEVFTNKLSEIMKKQATKKATK